MSNVEMWLEVASCGLARESAAEVRREIGEHLELAQESLIAGGMGVDEASGVALASLGDARVANRGYRRVLLTKGEARALRQGAMDARMFCSRPWLRRGILAAVVLGLLAASGFAATGHVQNAATILLVELGLSPMAGALLFRIKTPFWGRVFRAWKWGALLTAVLLLLGPNAGRSLWLMMVCLWPMAVSEVRRAGIRRKLPVREWPRSLYL
jgi:hypothetical protein